MAAAQSQNPPRPLVSQAVDESKTVPLRGTVHPLAQARFDQGAVPDSFAANRMLLMLNRSPEQEAALRQFLNDVHTPGSTGYHQWVTPAEFGELFGPADADIQAATSWLASHGFQVAKVTAGKNFIEFSGTAANVREAFHAQIHRYSVDNETHYA
ncbi:MAG: protease pro-enzyme activation domain-containing protein, partial [Candidatus Acidiferrales bacterium]